MKTLYCMYVKDDDLLLRMGALRRNSHFVEYYTRVAESIRTIVYAVKPRSVCPGEPVRDQLPCSGDLYLHDKS